MCSSDLGNAIYYNVYDGSQWTVTNTPINVPNFAYNGGGPPMAIVYNGALYVFYVGNDQWGICYVQYLNSNGSNEWSSPIEVGNQNSPNNQGTGYFAPVVYDPGTGPVLAVYFQGASNNGLMYYMSTTDPSSTANWSAVAQAGIAETTPKAPNVTGAFADALAGISMLFGSGSK